MENEKIENLILQLSAKMTEAAPADFEDKIKKQIPSPLKTYGKGVDNFNIVIDLRVSKLAAAAAIILTMILWANLFERVDSGGGGIFNDCKLLLQHHFTKNDNEILIAKARYEYLINRGKDASFYGEKINPGDSSAIILQWKLSDGSYRVVFANLHEETVTADELIKLQIRMLQKTK